MFIHFHPFSSYIPGTSQCPLKFRLDQSPSCRSQADDPEQSMPATRKWSPARHQDGRQCLRDGLVMGKGEVKQIHPDFEDVNPPMMHHAKIRKLRQTLEGGLGEVFIRNVLLSSLDLGLPPFKSRIKPGTVQSLWALGGSGRSAHRNAKPDLSASSWLGRPHGSKWRLK